MSKNSDLNVLFQEWEQHYKNKKIDIKRLCRDGIIKEKQYDSATPGILFILRDANDYPEGDLRDLLSKGPKYQIWHTIARWSAGLLRDFPPFDEIDSNQEVMKEALSSVAIMNIKKTSGRA